MTVGVGGSDATEQLKLLSNRTGDVEAISMGEYRARIQRAQVCMQDAGIDALYLPGGSSLAYFTGTSWHPSERMVAALLPRVGDVEYVAPAFERDTLLLHTLVQGSVHCWEENESPFELLGRVLASMMDSMGAGRARVGIDESTPFFSFDGIRKANPETEFVGAMPVTSACRSRKSVAELALMQRAKDMTLEVHRSVARILRPGITTDEVTEYIQAAHRALGASGSSFCIVLFGPDSAFPHGVKEPKALSENDVVLIDTGCLLHGYNSDITRTYVFGTPVARQREVWDAEKAAQAAAFAAAQVGVPAGEVDRAARASLEAAGYGPGYALPGLPHRTGHGIGLDIHEAPYLVASDRTPLAAGMCFSNEPMICVPGEFGVRLEDHFYVTETGPRWFTQPSLSIDDPFGVDV
ncbi:MAG: Xaa-Pro dipeptidase [Chlamydiales bacterium]|jgi:Xaa-Pro dipeptidase